MVDGGLCKVHGIFGVRFVVRRTQSNRELMGTARSSALLYPV